jgi:hypothetical protein
LLEALLGSVSCERVLVLLHEQGEGYPRQIARFWNASLFPIQRQLEKLEKSGILQSRMLGRTRLYSFSPDYPFGVELDALLGRAVSLYPVKERKRLRSCRKHPARRNRSVRTRDGMKRCSRMRFFG